MAFYWLIDLAALAAIGGLWMWFFIWHIRRHALLPTADPYIAEYLPEAVQ
jgi:hypothetical protein